MQRILFLLVLAFLVISFFLATDRFTWALEVFWVWAGLGIAYFTRDRFPLTSLLALLLAVHAIILIVGGIYTYEKVPLGNWMKSWFGFQRNHYDRIGHFAQGFIPAILIREIYIRKAHIQSPKWLFLFVTTFCLAFSAFFEMIEWWSAVAFGSGADAYLGSQGDVWDAQWDMLYCLIGAIVSQILLGYVHNKQLETISKK
jgi:putative membrane protein